ncbi:GFA family protein [Pseudomonas laurentiana]
MVSCYWRRAQTEGQTCGQCRCGQVTIEIVAQQLPPLYACHCLNCQRLSGSALSISTCIITRTLWVRPCVAKGLRSNPGNFEADSRSQGRAAPLSRQKAPTKAQLHARQRQP